LNGLNVLNGYFLGIRDLIYHALVVSSLRWGVKTDMRHADLESMTRQFNGKESRDVIV